MQGIGKVGRGVEESGRIISRNYNKARAKFQAHKCIKCVRGVRVVLDILPMPAAVLEQLCKRVKNSG